MPERRRRVLLGVTGVAYVAFWITLIADGPAWLGVILLVVSVPAWAGLLRPKRDPLLEDDMRIPAWLEYAPLGKLAVVVLAGAAVAGLGASFGAGWWSLPAGLAAAALLWLAVRNPLPDPFDHPARSGS